MTSLRRSITRFDVLLALAGVAFAVFFGIAVGEDEGAPWLFTPVLALVPLTLLWRRVSPIGALCGLIAAIGLSIALFGTYTRCGLVFPIEFFLVFAAGARLAWRGAVLGWLLGIAAACLTLGWDASAPLDEAGVYICVLLTGVWVIARLVHMRGRNVERLQEQTAALREARDDRARMEVAMDRARLSAELDELLQRRLGELATLAERGASQEGAAGHGDAARHRAGQPADARGDARGGRRPAQHDETDSVGAAADAHAPRGDAPAGEGRRGAPDGRRAARARCPPAWSSRPTGSSSTSSTRSTTRPT